MVLSHMAAPHTRVMAPSTHVSEPKLWGASNLQEAAGQHVSTSRTAKHRARSEQYRHVGLASAAQQGKAQRPQHGAKVNKNKQPCLSQC